MSSRIQFELATSNLSGDNCELQLYTAVDITILVAFRTFLKGSMCVPNCSHWVISERFFPFIETNGISSIAKQVQAPRNQACKYLLVGNFQRGFQLEFTLRDCCIFRWLVQ